MEKTCHTCKLEKSTSDFYLKHDKLSNNCKDCSIRKAKSNYLENKLERLEGKREHYQQNREYIVDRVRAYRKQNRELISAYVKSVRKRRNATQAKRRAKLLQAIPPWADVNAIEQFYESCPQGFHVDHIFPLQHKNFCGLHVLENLQYLSATENLSKGNRYAG